MNVNFEAIEKAWFKPKNTVLDELEEYIEKDIIKNFVKTQQVINIQNKIQELKKENENG